MKIDDISIEIIRELKQGRKSFKKIADKLRITENTVRTRVNKLIDAGVLDICGLVDPASLPSHQAVLMGIKLSNMNIVEKGEELSKLKGVISANVVTGRYDVILMVLFKKNFRLLEFYTEGISTVKGINFVETFVIYKSYNLKVPYQF